LDSDEDVAALMHHIPKCENLETLSLKCKSNPDSATKPPSLQSSVQLMSAVFFSGCNLTRLEPLGPIGDCAKLVSINLAGKLYEHLLPVATAIASIDKSCFVEKLLRCI
jgi:hypothetical protein